MSLILLILKLMRTLIHGIYPHSSLLRRAWERAPESQWKIPHPSKLLWDEHQFPVIGIPGTIDNDISGTEYTIGFDTAVQTAIEAVDRVRDTAHSHARTFLVEVMGRNSAAIALKGGVCTGAETVLLPHEKVDHKKIVDDVQRGMARGKESSIIIVAEGPVAGRSYEIQNILKDMYHMDTHVVILGHIQRGGSPASNDRFTSSQMGNMAISSE